MDQPAEADTPPAHREPSRREKIILQMLAAAQELQNRGLQVRAIPIGSDIVNCDGAAKHLTVTNPAAPGRGHVLITRELKSLTVKAIWESWHPLPDDAAIQQLASSVAHILAGPDLPSGKADPQ